MKKSLGARTIIFPAPVLIVCSYDSEKKPNAMAAAWGGICCSEPPCVAVSVRKQRKTYQNITNSRAFTINIPSESQVRLADYFGIFSGEKRNKFEDTGLTPVKSNLVDAPYIQEFSLILECKLIKTIELGTHSQFIGQILDLKADEEILNDKGSPDIEKVKPLLYAPGLSKYYGTGKFIAEAYTVGKSIIK